MLNILFKIVRNTWLSYFYTLYMTNIEEKCVCWSAFQWWGGKLHYMKAFALQVLICFIHFFLWQDFISLAYTDIPWLTMFCLMIFHLYNGLKENCTLSFEYWSFSELVKHSTILSHDAFINVKMSPSSQPDRQSHGKQLI